MKPSIGRIVHFVDATASAPDVPVHYPAIITKVAGELVNLTVFPDGHSRSYAMPDVQFDGSTEPAIRTWHFPEREA
jgi:hypothetical protein